MKRSTWALLAGLCMVIALALLWPGRGGDFVFDDLPNIVDNSRLHLTSLTWDGLRRASFSYEPGGGSRPLAMLSFALDYWRAGGLEPASFKETNLLIHGLTVLALAGLLRRILQAAQWPAVSADRFALGLTLVWAIHPLQVSAVLYVVQRMQTLGTLFVVLALLAYVGGRQAQQMGRPSLRYWVLMALSAALGFACKEDTVLLPLYTLALELTVLRFQAADERQSFWLRRTYTLFAGLGAAAFLLVLAPHYWHSDAYPGRTFSSLERLLTQARVLTLYLGQILVPTLGQLPFYYDGLLPSRGLVDPPETLLALGGLAALLAWAWAWRRRRPVFAAGVFLFFAGHFLTSNVLNLELAFEHRNHVPMIGIVLAAGDLASLVMSHLKPSYGLRALLALLLVGTLGGMTFIRASIWGSPLYFALQGVEWAPDSPRAWQLLSKAYYQRSGGDPDHPFFSFAVFSCQRAADMPGALVPLGDLITLKTIQGQDATADWRRLQDRLQHAVITPEARDVLWIMIGNVNKGVPLDAQQMVRSIVAFTGRMSLSPSEWANLADYLLYQSPEPERAYVYYLKAIQVAGPREAQIRASILRDLNEHGMEEWASRLQKEGAVPADVGH